MAIRACRPESGSLLRNREHMQQVKETLDEGYCDISGRAGDLKHIGMVWLSCGSSESLIMSIGKMGDVNVYLSEGSSFSTQQLLGSESCLFQQRYLNRIHLWQPNGTPWPDSYIL